MLLKAISIPVQNDIADRLSDEAYGVYIRMLCLYAKHGLLPKGVGVIAGIIMCKPTVVQEVLDTGLFIQHPDKGAFLMHHDLERQLQEHKTPIVIKPASVITHEPPSEHAKKLNGQFLLGIEVQPVIKEKQKKEKPKKIDQSNISAEIIKYLNECTGFELRTDIQSNQTPIAALLNKKYTPEDIKMVIEFKVREWLGTEMQKYLRPSTLFGNKHFDEYLNQARNPFSKTNKTAQQFYDIGTIKFDEV